MQFLQIYFSSTNTIIHAVGTFSKYGALQGDEKVLTKPFPIVAYEKILSILILNKQAIYLSKNKDIVSSDV